MTFNIRLRTRAASLVALAAIAFTAACSDMSTAPTATHETTRSNGLINGAINGLVDALIPVKALTRNARVTAAITRSVKFTKAGGSIEIAELGLRVDVPMGAIPTDTMTITVTALPGDMIAYDFAPHGTRFLKPLVFRQNLVGTSWGVPDFIGSIKGGYFKSASQLDQVNGSALVDELLPAFVLNGQATFEIHHFSGYMVSSGRQSSSSTEEAF